MKNADMFLIGIVIGVVLLVGATIALVLLRSGEPGYQQDNTPEGVAHNYLLALDVGEFERAYGYLSPALPGYPDSVEQFTEDIEDTWSYRYDRGEDFSLTVDAVQTTGDRSTVSVVRTVYYQGGVFDDGTYSSEFRMTLRRQNGDWRVVEATRYWDRCWSEPCR